LKIKEAITDRSIKQKIIRYGVKPLLWVLGIVLVLWLVLWIYVIKNEDQLKKRVATAIQEKARGEVKIGGLSVGFFRTFPLLSLQLKNVLVKDSVAAFEHKDFLRAEDIYLRISIPGLISGTSPIGKILIRNGEINVISDTLGNTNEYIFKTKPREGRQPATSLPDVELQSISATYKDPKRKKDYSGYIHKLKCSAKDNNGILDIKVNVRMLARNLSFNTLRGAYMKEKMLEGKIEAYYNRSNKDLSVSNVKLYLDNHPFYFTGLFNLDKDKGYFRLDIKSNDVMFSQASSLLTIPIQKALKPYSAMQPLNVTVKLFGKTTYQYIPKVEARVTVRDNKVITPQGVFENCSFDGVFSNEFVKGKERDDYNSYLMLTGFTGRWENISLKSDTIIISNLIKPYLQCDVASRVDLKTLNKLVDSKTFQFLKGTTSFKIDYKAPIFPKDSSYSNINGEININDAAIKYMPRDITLSNCDGDLKFVNNDLLVSKLNTLIGKTQLNMRGSAVNFLSLLNVSPEKLVLNWKINSPQLHLDDFKPMLSASNSKKDDSPKKEGTIAKTSSRIDKMFSEGDMYIGLETPVMDYKTFKATGVKADVVFSPSAIRMERVILNHAGGSMNVNGVMKNGAQKNPVSLNVYMTRMDIPQLFTAFNNFGQDAVTNKNLKGKLSADINFSSSITNKAELVNADSDGRIEFLLEGGELNNFQPIQEISQKAFKKQDFSEIKFADLKNTLELKGTTFIINSMDIRSTALNLTVEGVYDMKKGTDMFIKLPLRNLLKSQANTDISDEGKAAHGVSLRLRAKTGDDGKLKVSWDPLRRAKRNKNEVKDSADEKK
jgi:hypothetical protein